MSSGPVAVIDIGSNSIKSLVAIRPSDGSVQSVHVQTVEARISAGISGSPPRLSNEGMEHGLEAVGTLLAGVRAFSPRQIVLVATSAVRDAQNGGEFCGRVQAATGHTIRILSGEEEANLIGRGLTSDPALRDLGDFYVVDLGGGSLECLAFRSRKIERAASLQLGCVRLTEKFVPDVHQPFRAEAAQKISEYTRELFARSAFAFSLPADTVVVGTGGTIATIRSILGARAGREFTATDPIVSIATIREMLGWLGALPLAERRRIPGLPAARADVFPAALATLIAVAEVGGFSMLRNSVYNLRYGLADEILGAAGADTCGPIGPRHIRGQTGEPNR